MYGTELSSEYRPVGDRSLLAEPERTIAGNTVLRVGHTHDEPVQGADGRGDWQQTEHVVLTPEETRGLIEDLVAVLRGGTCKFCGHLHKAVPDDLCTNAALEYRQTGRLLGELIDMLEP